MWQRPAKAQVPDFKQLLTLFRQKVRNMPDGLTASEASARVALARARVSGGPIADFGEEPFTLVVDLSSEPVGKRWFRGAATLAGLCAAALTFTPGIDPFSPALAQSVAPAQQFQLNPMLGGEAAQPAKPQVPLDPAQFPPYFPSPSLRLRSQLAINLIDNDRKMSLEDVVKLKHSYRMLLADRVRDDLVAAVRATSPQGDVARAIDLIAAWDKTVSPESRGGTLFETWWRRYLGRGPGAPDSAYAQPWSAAAPTSTPRGLRSPPAPRDSQAQFLCRGRS